MEDLDVPVQSKSSILEWQQAAESCLTTSLRGVKKVGVVCVVRVFRFAPGDDSTLQDVVEAALASEISYGQNCGTSSNKSDKITFPHGLVASTLLKQQVQLKYAGDHASPRPLPLPTLLLPPPTFPPPHPPLQKLSCRTELVQQCQYHCQLERVAYPTDK